MNNLKTSIKSIIILFILFFLAANSENKAQLDGARVYWPLPKNTNIFAFHGITGTINAAWNNFERVQPNVNIQNNLYMLTYTRVQPILGKTAYWTIALPAGQMDFLASPGGELEYTKGIGDPAISATVNLFGAPGMMAKEFIRYDLTTTVNFGIKASFPLGTYDSDDPLNMGSNQYKLKLFMPIVHSFTNWIPEDRLVLDIMPSVLFTTVNDNSLGTEIEQDPIFVVESHLSRDITKKAFISLDYSYIAGGKSTYTDNDTGIMVRESDAFDTHILGVTVNYKINDNMQIFLTHAQTISDANDAFDLEGSLLKATLSWSWHDYFEKVGDFHGN